MIEQSPFPHRSAMMAGDIPKLFDPEIMELAIRPDAVVRVHGIPFDLTTDEAEKLAKVILAHAVQRGGSP